MGDEVTIEGRSATVTSLGTRKVIVKWSDSGETEAIDRWKVSKSGSGEYNPEDPASASSGELSTLNQAPEAKNPYVDRYDEPSQHHSKGKGYGKVDKGWGKGKSWGPPAGTGQMMNQMMGMMGDIMACCK